MRADLSVERINVCNRKQGLLDIYALIQLGYRTIGTRKQSSDYAFLIGINFIGFHFAGLFTFTPPLRPLIKKFSSKMTLII